MVADWRPQPPNRSGAPTRSSRLIRGLGPPIGDLDLSIEVASILRGYRRPRWKATPTPRSTGNSKSELLIDLRAGIVDPPSRSPVPTEDVGDLGIAD
ncbi:hypothetical protein CDL15_Pgr012572 [Punica granatum]|uniref:Uncharacterized protein n=1 Tax=Punica granatum TaxID=22663 RepID=A0A218XXR0_PUNGR|nr:hypothetical protein CDL15_Pgr012572 [Punica granatum]